MTRTFGLSNLYLKAGFALVVLSMAVLASLLLVPSMARYPGGQLAGFCLLSGAVLYVIGRIAHARRSRVRA